MTPKTPASLDAAYRRALQLIADHLRGIAAMAPATMREFAISLAKCDDTQKCCAHFLMDRKVIKDDHFLRFHWMLTKACHLDCLPEDKTILRELYSIANTAGEEGAGHGRLRAPRHHRAGK